MGNNNLLSLILDIPKPSLPGNHPHPHYHKQPNNLIKLLMSIIKTNINGTYFAWV
jgi:hypothetical protein